MNIHQDIIKALERFRDKTHNGHAEKAANALGITPPTLSRWLSGKHIPKLESLLPAFEALNARLTFQGKEEAREVCFVNARVVSAPNGGPPIVPEDYLAVPVVDEVGAGPGIIPQDDIKSWFLVYRDISSIKYRKDLIAVQISAGSDSMSPLLNPYDIVLVDKEDTRIVTGRIMLVKEPDEGAGMIKRVAVDALKDGDTRITFYSDNAANNAPRIFSLRNDYFGEMDRAIVGHVVWAWSDVSNK